MLLAELELDASAMAVLSSTMARKMLRSRRFSCRAVEVGLRITSSTGENVDDDDGADTVRDNGAASERLTYVPLSPKRRNIHGYELRSLLSRSTDAPRGERPFPSGICT
jgi:hypothetical protein